MVLSLLLGALLGAVAVIFALQNNATVTVAFMSEQITAPLAIVLLGTLLSGVLVTLLVLLPSLIRGEMYLKTLKRQKREVEDEFAKFRTAHTTEVRTSTPQKTTIETHSVSHPREVYQ